MDASGVWQLAPFYDFTFQQGPNGWQTLSVAGEGANPGQKDLLKLAAKADIKPRDAKAMIEQVRSAIADFPHHAACLRASTRKRVQTRLASIDRA